MFYNFAKKITNIFAKQEMRKFPKKPIFWGGIFHIFFLRTKCKKSKIFRRKINFRKKWEIFPKRFLQFARSPIQMPMSQWFKIYLFRDFDAGTSGFASVGTACWETKNSGFITFINYARYSVLGNQEFRVHHVYKLCRVQCIWKPSIQGSSCL